MQKTATDKASSNGMPDFWDVVFCGVECSVWWYKEKGIYPVLTNSEKLC